MFCGRRLPQVLLSLHVIPVRLWFCVQGSVKAEPSLPGLLVLLQVEESSYDICSIVEIINPDQISSPICRNPAPNVQGTSMLHCCAQTLIIVLLSSPLTNYPPTATQNLLHFNSSVRHFLQPSSYIFVQYFSRSLSLVFTLDVWLFCPQFCHDFHFWLDFSSQ